MEFSSKLPFSLLPFFFLFAFIAYAQDSPQDYVDVHNAARAEVGVPAIAWDQKVAEYAQNYANLRKADCRLVPSGSSLYSENIEVSTSTLSGADAVKLWVALKTNYDYNSNTCVGGECLEYVTVVWRKSIHVGCGKVTCDNGGTFVVCNYDPPRIVGERPY